MKTKYQKTRILSVFVRVITVCSTLLISHQAIALATLLGEAENGGKLLDTRCSACHVNMFGGDGSAIYTREDHSVKTVEGLMARVQVCNINTQNSELSSDQMDDITAHLNETFYQFED